MNNYYLKEILQDIGINVIGDIIAILKHAKKAHQKVRQKIIYNNQSLVTLRNLKLKMIQQKRLPFP